jgi:hypothetical protein
MLVTTKIRAVSSRLPFWLAVTVMGCVILAIFGHVTSSTEPSAPKQVTDMPVGVGGKPVESMMHPISLTVTYRDKRVIEGVGGAQAHVVDSTYVFKNRSPLAVKLVFPPIGYTSGGMIPITPQCSDTTNMPKFCSTAQVVEFAPFAEKRFTTSGYTIFLAHGAAPFPERFIFGPAADRNQKNVVVDYVESLGTFVK